eukprot:gene4643-8041_t
MCYYHVRRKLNPRYNEKNLKGISADKRDNILKPDVRCLHAARSRAEQLSMWHAIRQRWRANGLGAFATYWENQWINGPYHKWYIGALPVGWGATNNSLESFQRDPKREMQRARHSPLRFLRKIELWVRKQAKNKCKFETTVVVCNRMQATAKKLGASSNVYRTEHLWYVYDDYNCGCRPDGPPTPATVQQWKDLGASAEGKRTHTNHDHVKLTCTLLEFNGDTCSCTRFRKNGIC